MKNPHAFLSEILADGKLDDAELMRVCDAITADDVLDLQDVELLIRIYVGAKSHPAEFDGLFFGVLRSVLLDDDKILPEERFYLLQMLYANHKIRKEELEFLEQLQREATEVGPEFDRMLEGARDAYERGTDVGGRPTK
ncbi:MAG: TerB family tellurite resistance protein [Planctomycetaceae bacterium]|nr:TerB family tellurite resistance protein [Planctomycetaceae bacterium]